MIDKDDSEHQRRAIGQRLREARERQNLSLEEVEQSLHIHAHQLEALERGNYEAFPHLLWGRGFLIQYGTYLGLDGERLAGQAFPVRRTSGPTGFLRRRWRGLVTAGGAIALVAVFVVTSIAFPNNPFTGDPFTGRVADFLARIAPGAFLASGPQRVAIFGYAQQSSINGKNAVLVVEVEEEGLGVLAVPADTWARIPGHGQGNLGEVLAMDRPELTRQTVAGLTAKEVQHYVVVTPGGIKEIVDSMGGVRIDVPNPVSGRGAPEGPEIALSPGPQKLDGAQALVYLQGRDLRDDAEILKRQQTFLYTMFGQALSVSTLLASPDTFVKLSDNVETDMRWIQEAQLAARVLKLKGEDETPKMNVLNDP